MTPWIPPSARAKLARERVSSRFDRGRPGAHDERNLIPERYLPIYLNDHLAGSTVGLELAKRTAASNRGDEEFGPALERIRDEIEADKRTLEAVMEELGVGRDRLKPVGAWLAEKLGRLKLNGHLRGYSPLSRLIELEGLYVGISGKARLWGVLEASVGKRVPGTDFAALAERADRQRTEVEQLQTRAAEIALA